mmetsp:Transcript_10885/g.39402  ORF Transcript_10885/g.39402 Transcript_10885/m.39402 type:complete len:331 (+) Transcript_10885:80-1072(+)
MRSIAARVVAAIVRSTRVASTPRTSRRASAPLHARGVRRPHRLRRPVLREVRYPIQKYQHVVRVSHAKRRVRRLRHGAHDDAAPAAVGHPLQLVERVLVRVVVAEIQRQDLVLVEPLVEPELAEQERQRLALVPRHSRLHLEHLASGRLLQPRRVGRHARVDDGIDLAPVLRIAVPVVHRDAKLVVVHRRPGDVLDRLHASIVDLVHELRGPRRGLMHRLVRRRRVVVLVLPNPRRGDVDVRRRRVSVFGPPRPPPPRRYTAGADDVQPVRPGVVQLRDLNEVVHLLAAPPADHRGRVQRRDALHRRAHLVGHERALGLLDDRGYRAVVV